MKKKMKLSEFISETLKEIIDGIKSAQEHAQENRASINPPNVNWSKEKNAYYIILSTTGEEQAPLLSEIEFDILLTIGDDDTVTGGVGVFAASLGLGVQGAARNYSEAVNRVKFKILAKLPQQET